MRVFDAVVRGLGRLPLWYQFVGLGLFVVLVPLVIITDRFFANGRDILIEHETVDLGDEANLRVNEFRESFDSVVEDARRAAQPLTKDPAAAPEPVLRALVTRVTADAAPPDKGDPERVGQVRRKCLADAVVGAVVARAGTGEPVAAVPARDRRGGPELAEETARACVRDVAGWAADPDRVAPGRVGPLRTRPADGAVLVGVGAAAGYVDGRPTLAVVVVVDLTRLVHNRSGGSPRHHLLVADAAGKLLVRPPQRSARTGADALADVPGWGGAKPTKDEWLRPLAESGTAAGRAAESAAARDARHAAMLRTGGVRLPGVPVPALGALYVKGDFGGRKGASLEPDEKKPDGPIVRHFGGETAPARVTKLNGDLARAVADDPDLRAVELTKESDYVELSHPDPARLAAARRAVDEWWAQAAGGAVAWSDPLECKTFQGQLTYLRLGPDDDAAPPRLVLVASEEELYQDVTTRFSHIVWRWVVPTVGVAALLTVALVAALTSSLARLARNAPKLLDPEAPARIEGGGSREVHQLARALSDVVGKLRDTAGRFQTILRSAGEGIVVAASSGVIEEANRAAAKMFGYARSEELVGVPVAALVDGTAAVAAADAGVMTLDGSVESVPPGAGSGRGLTDALRGKRRDGSTFWLEATLRAVELPGRHVITGVFRDVTQRREAEEQIRTLNADLEARVRVRTAELAEANAKLEGTLKQAEAASRAKDTFVANMSHELRQPLHIIIGFTEALKEEAADADSPGLVPDLNRILGAAKHLLDLINDILDLAKIAAGKMDLAVAPFDVSRMVEDVRSLVGPLAGKNGNRFAVEVAPGVGRMQSDERRVRQVLINLLSNAFKFTHGGAVTLSVRPAEQGGRAAVEFAVADTGKGMNPDQLARLFQRFYQADDATTRVQGGTGLGLAITQSFNEVLGGDPIEVSSEEGEGSRFVVRYPRTRPDSRPTRADSTAPVSPALGAEPGGGGAESARDSSVVLVIDDDPSVRELMGRFLSKEGFRVVGAAGGREGLDLARELRPAAVTLDVMMPGVDGWQVLAALKADPVTADIPVVLLTIVDDRGRGFALGAADYLTKPIDWPRLGSILRRYQTPGDGAPVLVVDDDAESRGVVRRFLEREGWRVTEAADGEAGLRAVGAEAPALVLLDLMMPVLDGFGFLTELPARFPSLRVPVVVLTAKDLTPDDFDRLNGRVAKILEKGRLTQIDILAAQVRAVADAARRRRLSQPTNDPPMTHQ